MRSIRVAVAGLGHVGGEAVRLLLAQRERFRSRLGAELELAAVADRGVEAEARRLRLPKGVRRLKDPLALLKTPGIDIVVELLGGLEAPRRLVLGSLAAGRSVVTANKRLLAYCWDEVRRASALRGGRVYFEGSVAGGIPLLQALDAGLAGNRIEAVHGILNGTTNYILSRAEEGVAPAEALREAQRLGLAEKDPTLDLSGQDSAQKVSVLASLLSGSWVKPGQVACEGIARLDAEDIAFARAELGRAVRLIGSLRLDWGKVLALEAWVQPTLVPLDHPLASVRREFNAVLVKASSAGELMFYGRGAGPGPAASAVLGDALMLARDLLGGVPPRRAEPVRARLAPFSETRSAFYLRLHAQDRPGVLGKIAAALGRSGISIATIHQGGARAGAGVPVMLTTHPTSEGSFRRALAAILASGTVSSRHAVMRLL